MADDIHWFAGGDWASEIHQVVLVDTHGTVTGEHAFPHGGEGLGAMCDWILTTAGAPAEVIGVAIEVPHGPVVETLLERGFLVHSVNPKQLDAYIANECFWRHELAPHERFYKFANKAYLEFARAQPAFYSAMFEAGAWSAGSIPERIPVRQETTTLKASTGSSSMGRRDS